MFRNIVALVFTLFIPLGMAADNWPELVTPPGSGLHDGKIVDVQTLPHAVFSGQTWISGTFRAQWPTDLKHLDPRDKIEVDVVLDKGETEHLPHFGRYEVVSVDMMNREAAVQIVFGKDLGGRLLNRQSQSAQIHGRFQITDYDVGIECDYPWAHATLVEADIPQTAKISSPTDLGGC